MIYVLTDRNDKDREDFVIDSFDTREDAEEYAREWSEQYGSCEVEEWSSIDDARGIAEDTRLNVCNAHINLH